MICNRSTAKSSRGPFVPVAPLVVLLFLLLASCSQVPVSEAEPELAPAFGTSTYDAATGLAKHDIGVFAVGQTNGNLHGTNKGGEDAFIRMYARSGRLLWGRQFGTPYRDRVAGVASPSNAEVYLAGTTGGNLAVPGSNGSYDAFIRKYTSGGYLLWTRQFGSSGSDWASGVATVGSHIYVAGSATGSVAGSKGKWDAFIRKYSPTGGVLWTRQFGTSADELVTDVAVNNTGYAYVVGYTTGSLSGTNGGGRDMFIRKYSPTGGVLWTRQWHYNGNDIGTAVVVSGINVYLVGHSSTSAPYSGLPIASAVHVLKYTSWGSLTGRLTRRDTRSIDTTSDASVDGNGNLYISGTTSFLNSGYYSSRDGYVLKVGVSRYTSPRTVWKRRINLNKFDTAAAVLAHTNGEVYAAGSTAISDKNSDAYLRRLRGFDGFTVWTK